jgi:hypothetical protein
MRLSQKQVDKKSNSYFHIMSQISSFLSVPLRKRERERRLVLKNSYKYSIEKSYEVRSGSDIANYIIISYLLKYPLFGYKFSAIQVYVELLKLTKNKEYKLDSGLDKLNQLKNILQYQYSSDKILLNRNSLSHHFHIIKNFPF